MSQAVAKGLALDAKLDLVLRQQAEILAILRATHKKELDKYELALLVALIDSTAGNVFTAKSAARSTDPAVADARRQSVGDDPREIAGLLYRASGQRIGNSVLARAYRNGNPHRSGDGQLWLFEFVGE